MKKLFLQKSLERHLLAVYDVDLALVWNLTLKEKGETVSGYTGGCLHLHSNHFQNGFCFVVVFEE
jgi:hypothetical protein